MVYWPGVFAPSKKDVSGSEYIIRNRALQGKKPADAQKQQKSQKYGKPGART
jgi:hypothetical protein